MIASKTLLRMKYARVVNLYSKKTGMPIEKALDDFYNSITYRQMSKGISDMHCMSDEYLVQNLMEEYGKAPKCQ